MKQEDFSLTCMLVMCLKHMCIYIRVLLWLTQQDSNSDSRLDYLSDYVSSFLPIPPHCLLFLSFHNLLGCVVDCHTRDTIFRSPVFRVPGIQVPGIQVPGIQVPGIQLSELLASAHPDVLGLRWIGPQTIWRHQGHQGPKWWLERQPWR